MSETKSVKFTDKELDTLKDIQGKYAKTQIKFGQIGFAKMKIEHEISLIKKTEEELKTEFFEIQKTEQNFIKEITEKYGDGVLDPATGLFNLNENK